MIFVCICYQQILDEQKNPHLCAFAIRKINAGEEIVYDYGDPNCPWRHVFIFMFTHFVTPHLSQGLHHLPSEDISHPNQYCRYTLQTGINPFKNIVTNAIREEA